MASIGQAVERGLTPGGYGESGYGAGPYGGTVALRPAKRVLLGVAAETGTARGVARSKASIVAAAEELSTAAAVDGRHVVRVPVAQAVEASSAGVCGPLKRRRVRRAVERDEAANVVQVGAPLKPVVLVAANRVASLGPHRPTPTTLTAAHRGRSRIEARHG